MGSYKIFSLFLAFVASQSFVWSAQLFAQDFQALSASDNYLLQVNQDDIIDISAELRNDTAYKNINAKIRSARKLKSERSGLKKEIGDINLFFVRDVLSLSEWDSISAICLYSSDKVAIWLSEESKSLIEQEFDIHEILDELTYGIEHASNSYSVNPEIGIYDRNLNYFGDPPDIDGDGVLDILLLDIQDNFEATGSFVAGFFIRWMSLNTLIQIIATCYI